MVVVNRVTLDHRLCMEDACISIPYCRCKFGDEAVVAFLFRLRSMTGASYMRGYCQECSQNVQDLDYVSAARHSDGCSVDDWY